MVMAAVVGGVAVGALASGGPDIPAPDPSIGRAQEKMADLASRQQDYYENTISPLLMEQVKQQTAISKQTADSQTAIANQQIGQSDKLNQRYWGTQVPLEDQLISKAQAYNDPAEQEKMAGQAGADVTQQSNVAQQGVMQSLRARGINLGSPAAIAAMTEMNTQAAMAKAGAINKTRETARQMGWQRLGEATALGKGLPTFGQGSASLAIGANNGAVGAGMSGVQAAGALGASSTGQLNSQIGAYGAYGQLGVQSSNLAMQGAQISAANDPSGQILGAAAGYGMSYLGKKYGGG